MELFHEELDTPIDSKFNFSKSEVSAICFCEECKRFIGGQNMAKNGQHGFLIPPIVQSPVPE